MRPGVSCKQLPVSTCKQSSVSSHLQERSAVTLDEVLKKIRQLYSYTYRYAQTWHQSSLSSVARYQPLQPEYFLAPYLSAVKGFKSRKLISRFRCGCHGLHVDTGRLLPLTQQVPREQRHCVFCASGLAEDEHQFVFDCPAYCAIRNRFTNIFWGPAPTLSSFFTLFQCFRTFEYLFLTLSVYWCNGHGWPQRPNE